MITDCFSSKLRSSLFREFHLCVPPLVVHPYYCRFMVTLAWIMGKNLTLLFDPLQSIVLFLSGASLLQRDSMIDATQHQSSP
jgi:hypothetical protein